MQWNRTHIWHTLLSPKRNLCKKKYIEQPSLSLMNVRNAIWWRTIHNSIRGNIPLQPYLKPLSHQTAMPQRLYSVLKPCQRAVGSPRNTPKILNLSVIACTQRPHSVYTAYTRRSHSVFTASMTFSQRASSCCSVFTASRRRAHGAHTAYSKCTIYTVSLQRARGALTTRPRRSRRPRSVLSNTLCKRQAAAFVLSMPKINAAAWRSRRLHSVSTALLAFAQRAPRRSAIF